jgi:hypothetical protein
LRNSLIEKNIFVSFMLLFQIVFCSGCETLYAGKGGVVHDDK